MAWEASKYGPGYGTVAHAFDINEVANTIHEFNTHRTVSTRDITRLAPGDLDAFQCDVWLLSPPCQPYTRKGKRLGSADPRAGSFLSMLEALPSLARLPTHLLLENVLGFEKSETCARLTNTLTAAGYQFHGHVLNSSDFGVPKSRPRFYIVARRHRPFTSTFSPSGTIHDHPAWLISPFGTCDPPGTTLQSYLRATYRAAVEGRRRVRHFPLTSTRSVLCPTAPTSKIADRITAYRAMRPKILRSVNATTAAHARASVTPGELAKLERLGQFAHLTNPRAHAKPTLTGKLARVVDEARARAWHDVVATSPACPLDGLGLRHFAPEEMAALHGFPDTFAFPVDKVACKQAWQVVGNSLSVRVVAALVDFLLAG
ncbi:DNA (cytosine-5-)-methyltransferase [Allomyces macrogynus ATCC 38327]|uniref:tRNA (cytosine(38)-C(5))-methyltransferase n=1 Tax=Allomyces macrogynus (strain ATCC 38327) TaxID=578462 RepID=A0A0L0TDS3_ALLM3|nr:DNA (cytosine-5-)-methyltransferase [Allomyces macrogynus ATCC 38327]|eukprot:KNE72830.1 DNA (cytosine-5-)-methyltransferase [Allomyces macrogynus ATCC 38327]